VAAPGHVPGYRWDTAGHGLPAPPLRRRLHAIPEHTRAAALACAHTHARGAHAHHYQELQRTPTAALRCTTCACTAPGMALPPPINCLLSTRYAPPRHTAGEGPHLPCLCPCMHCLPNWTRANLRRPSRTPPPSRCPSAIQQYIGTTTRSTPPLALLVPRRAHPAGRHCAHGRQQAATAVYAHRHATPA